MKATDPFINIITAHLQGIAQIDPLFAETLKKPEKNIDDCINYILTTVQKSGRNGFADEEVFNMAVHYYDEDNIKAGAKVNCKVVVNQPLEAMKEAISNRTHEPKKVVKKIEKEPAPANQTTLF